MISDIKKVIPEEWTQPMEVTAPLLIGGLGAHYSLWV